MAEKKNQHFVPQSYLRFFSNNEKTIGAYHMNIAGSASNEDKKKIRDSLRIQT